METTERLAPDGSGYLLMQDNKIVGFRRIEGQGETPAPAQGQADEDGPGFLKETARAIGGGVRDGLQEMGETLQWAGTGIRDAVTGGSDLYYTNEEGWEWLTEEEVKKYTYPEWAEFMTTPMFGEGGTIDLPEVADNETVAGGIARGAVQFLTGYLTFSKGAGMTRGAVTKFGQYTRAAGAGAATDFAAFDAHEERFSDFLRDNLGLRDPITEFLSADEDDSILEGKLKNALEGAGLGLAVDGLLSFTKLFKRAKKAQIEEGDEAAAKVMDEGIAEVEQQLSLFDETTDANLQHKGAGPDKVIDHRKKPEGDTQVSKSEGEVAGEVTAHNAAKAGAEDFKAHVGTKAFLRAMEKEAAARTTSPGGFAFPKDEIEDGLFNHDYIDADIEIREVWETAAETAMEFGGNHPKTFSDMAEDALDWGAEYVEVDKNILRQSLARQAEDAVKQQGLMIAAKKLSLSLSREVEKLAEKIHLGQATDEEKVKFRRVSSELVEVAGNLKSVIRGAAQTTAAGRIRTTDAFTGQQLAAADIAKQIKDTANPSSEDLDNLARAIHANKVAGNGPSTLLNIVEQSAKSKLRKGMDVINEYYVNSILSGPKTHMINVISNGLNMVLLPAEKMVGGALGGDMAQIREGFRQYAGMRIAINDSIKATAAAFRKGHNILDPEAAILEANGVDYRAIRTDSENPVINTFVNGLGGFVRMPSRFLLAGDELFKQMNYRSSVYAKLMGEASDLAMAGKISRDEVANYVEQRMKLSIGKHGEATSQFELDYAREATFTQPLRRDSALGSFAAGVQDMTNKFPPLKLVMPFVRTPSNILKAGLQRTPILQFASKTLREDLMSGNPRRVASARGKMATGVMLYSAAYMAAVEGVITGTGPADPALRARMLETGWRPLSVRVEKDDGSVEYVEYRRLEPFATALGVVADIVDISGQVSDMDGNELAAAAIIAFTENVSSKSFVQGMVDATETLADPKRYAAGWLRNYASSMVPQSAFMREARKVTDPAMRDVRNFTDAIKNTIPGFSESVPAKRSWVTGEAVMYPKGWGGQLVSPVGEAMASIMPITATDWKQDKVLDELADLQHGFSAPTRTQQNVELTEAQYSRFLELHGTIRLNKRTLHQQLGRMMESKLYQAAKAAGTGPDSEVVTLVQKEIQRYRKAAFMALMKEDTEVRAKWIGHRQETAKRQRQVLSGIAELGQ